MSEPIVKIYLVTSYESAIGKTDLIRRMAPDYHLYAEDRPFHTVSRVYDVVESNVIDVVPDYTVTVAVEAATTFQGEYLEPLLRSLAAEFREGKVSFRKITIEA